jgi:O-antigen/teichoic acid export membrane protein
VIAALFAFVWSASIISVCSEVFKAVNRPQNLVRMHSVSLITLAAFVSLGAITIGAVGVAGAVSLSYALTASYALYLALPSIQLRFRDWFMDAAAPLAAAAAMAGAMFAFSLAVDPLHQPLVGAWALTAAEAVLGAGVYLTALAAIDPGRRDAARSYLRRGRGEKSALMRAG